MKKIFILLLLVFTILLANKKQDQELRELQASAAVGADLVGQISQLSGDYPKALKKYQKSLSVRKKYLGEAHAETAKSYENMGSIYTDMGEYFKALKYYKKTLTIRKKVLKKNHPDTINSYNDLGQIYIKLGDYPQALHYYRLAMLANEEVSGTEHLDTAKSYNLMGMLYYQLRDYQKALEYYNKALTVRKKFLDIKTTDTSINFNEIDVGSLYNNIGMIYQAKKQYPQALKYLQKSLMIFEKYYGEKQQITARGYNNLALVYQQIGDFPQALKYHKKALIARENLLGKNHADTAGSYDNLGSLYQEMKDYSNALEYYQKSLTVRKKIFGNTHILMAISYYHLGSLYYSMADFKTSHHYANKAFTIFLKNRNNVFTILDSKQKEKYLNTSSGYISLLLKSTYLYFSQLYIENKTTKVQQLLKSGTNAWLNYKGSIFDSENSIAMLYSSTNNKKIKVKIADLISSKRYLAKLYQSLPKAKERDAWQKNIKITEEKITSLTNQLSAKARNFREHQGLKSITYRDITSHLKKDELYIDYARVDRYYYLFSLDKKNNITFARISDKNTKKIDNLIKAFREDVTTILNDINLTDEKLNVLTQNSKEKLSELYALIIKEPLGDTLKDKTSLIISPDGALRLLPFEALFDKKNDKYFIEEKEIRYIPSGKELVRLYKYSKNKVSKTKKSAVIFDNPNFNTKIASASKEQIAITPNTSRSGIIKSLFRMRFSPLPGTKAEAKAIEATLKKNTVSEYQKENATESNLLKVKEPRILHIATHGFFINDNTIPNPMLKSGIALAGANASVIKGKSDGIVTALKLSGLDLKGTDLVVLSACQTGVVDINSTDSVSGLSKAFIQAGAKDIVMSLWSVDDQATKELMSSFYQKMKENRNYAKALKAAKLKMIKEGKHPFYWAAFVVSGL